MKEKSTRQGTRIIDLPTHLHTQACPKNSKLEVIMYTEDLVETLPGSLQAPLVSVSSYELLSC